MYFNRHNGERGGFHPSPPKGEGGDEGGFKEITEKIHPPLLLSATDTLADYRTKTLADMLLQRKG